MQSSKGDLQIQLRLERTMIQLGRRLQRLQRDVAAQRREHVVRLPHHRARRRPLQRRILLQRLVVHLDSPSLLMEQGHPLRIPDCITLQMLQRCATVLVREDVVAQNQRNVYVLDVDLPYGVWLHDHALNSCNATGLHLVLAQCHRAVAFERHDEVLVKRRFDKAHRVCRGKPYIGQHVAVGHLIGQDEDHIAVEVR
jgi:hypothetical protein